MGAGCPHFPHAAWLSVDNLGYFIALLGKLSVREDVRRPLSTRQCFQRDILQRGVEHRVQHRLGDLLGLQWGFSVKADPETGAWGKLGFTQRWGQTVRVGYAYIVPHVFSSFSHIRTTTFIDIVLALVFFKEK